MKERGHILRNLQSGHTPIGVDTAESGPSKTMVGIGKLARQPAPRRARRARPLGLKTGTQLRNAALHNCTGQFFSKDAHFFFSTSESVVFSFTLLLPFKDIPVRSRCGSEKQLYFFTFMKLH